MCKTLLYLRDMQTVGGKWGVQYSGMCKHSNRRGDDSCITDTFINDVDLHSKLELKFKGENNEPHAVDIMKGHTIVGHVPKQN